MHIYSLKTESNIYIVQAHHLSSMHRIIHKLEGEKYKGFETLRLGHNEATEEKIIAIIERN